MKQSPLLKLVQARGTSVALTTLRPLICRSLLALRSLVTTWLNPDATPPAWMKQKQSSKLYFHLISANLPSYYSWGASRGKKIKKKINHNSLCSERWAKIIYCLTVLNTDQADLGNTAATELSVVSLYLTMEISLGFKGFSDEREKGKHGIYCTLLHHPEDKVSHIVRTKISRSSSKDW